MRLLLTGQGLSEALGVSDYISQERLYSHKLTPQEVQELVYMHKQGMSYTQLSRKFGVHRNTVYNILQRIKKENLQRKDR